MRALLVLIILLAVALDPGRTLASSLLVFVMVIGLACAESEEESE